MPSGGDAGAEDEYAVEDDSETEAQEKMDEDEAAAEFATGKAPPKNTTPSGQAIPALDEEQEYEWKWKVSAASQGLGSQLTPLAAQDGGLAEDILPLSMLLAPLVFCLFCILVACISLIALNPSN